MHPNKVLFLVSALLFERAAGCESNEGSNGGWGSGWGGWKGGWGSGWKGGWGTGSKGGSKGGSKKVDQYIMLLHTVPI
ncbi:AEL_collapsed_G0032260.mRNA.1.CDS.1 [Saccharomyces cerevisiae]|nr:AEL_collapsed_G0032260.mRNA.1.CDS.1 [Saccharomyces cerevisiae]